MQVIKEDRPQSAGQFWDEGTLLSFGAHGGSRRLHKTSQEDPHQDPHDHRHATPTSPQKSQSTSPKKKPPLNLLAKSSLYDLRKDRQQQPSVFQLEDEDREPTEISERPWLVKERPKSAQRPNSAPVPRKVRVVHERLRVERASEREAENVRPASAHAASETAKPPAGAGEASKESGRIVPRSPAWVKPEPPPMLKNTNILEDTAVDSDNDSIQSGPGGGPPPMSDHCDRPVNANANALRAGRTMQAWSGMPVQYPSITQKRAALAAKKNRQHLSSIRAQHLLSRTKFFKEFESIMPGIIATLAQTAKKQSCKPGDIIFRQGDPPVDCYVVMR
ncbi:unnamed protein product, partial [Polarella glacialis]